jgi:hypothetical protein
VQTGLKSAVHPMQCISLMMICYGLKVKRVGLVAASVKRRNAVIVKIDTKKDENGDHYNDW